MRALIVYESMYGNTHVIAEHLAEGLRSHYEVEVVAVDAATPEKLTSVDLLVVGGPTHIHGLSSSKSRVAAEEAAAKPGSGLRMDPDAGGEGLRDWLSDLPAGGPVPHAAAFDTRLDAASILTGRASKAIEKRLAKYGYDLVADPESFLVDKQNHLIDGEADRATQWAKDLAESLAANP